MFAPLLNAIRADIDQQIDWAKLEVRRQSRHALLIGVFAGMATLAVLGAIIVGLIALYFWLTTQTDPFIALATIGGSLLLLALMLFVLVFVWRRPRITARPQLQVTRPTALFGTLRHGRHDKLVASSDQMLELAASTVRHGSRSALSGTLVLAAIMGLIVGRRL
jgi:hypothetical protein